MHVFIIGATGGVGSLLAHDLITRGDTVTGLIRRPEQGASLQAAGITPAIGDLTYLDPQGLANLLTGVDAIVFTAGASGGGAAATTAIDGDGVTTAIDAAKLAGISRFLLVSVFPEAWRERNLGASLDHYIAVKKSADIALSQSDLDWVILRPAVLTDDAGHGTATLGPAGTHTQITRHDVAATLTGLLHEPRISQQILELNAGPIPIGDAIAANIRPTTPRC